METCSVTDLNKDIASVCPRAVCIPHDSVSPILDSFRCHILHTFSISQLSLIFCSVLGVVTTWQHIEFSLLSGLMLLFCLFVLRMLPKAHSKGCRGVDASFLHYFLIPKLTTISMICALQKYWISITFVTFCLMFLMRYIFWGPWRHS